MSSKEQRRRELRKELALVRKSLKISKKLKRFLSLSQPERLLGVKSGKFDVLEEEVDILLRNITPTEFTELCMTQWKKKDAKLFRRTFAFAKDRQAQVGAKDIVAALNGWHIRKYGQLPRIRVSELSK